MLPETPWLFISERANVKRVTRRIQERLPNFQVQHEVGTLKDAAKLIRQYPDMNKLIIELDDEEKAKDYIQDLAEIVEGDTVLILIGVQSSLDYYHDLMALGVDEYFAIPIDAAAMAKAIVKYQAVTVGLNTDAIAVIGVHGGVGASTFAANLAWQLGNKAKRTTCILDLDLHFGSTGLALGVNESNDGLYHVLDNSEKADAHYLADATVEIDANLSLLDAQRDLRDAILFTDTDYLNAFDALGKYFEKLVLDIPHSCIPYTQSAFRHTKTFVLITEISLTFIRDCRRIIENIEHYHPQANIILLAHDYSFFSSGDISKEQFEQAVGEGIFQVIPYDKSIMHEAENLGVIAVKEFPRHKYTKTIDKVIAHIEELSDA